MNFGSPAGSPEPNNMQVRTQACTGSAAAGQADDGTPTRDADAICS